MKKVLTSVISVVIIIAMMATLSGCFDQQKFVGTWKTDLDISETLEKAVKETSPEMADYVDFGTISPITLVLTFRNDNIYSQSMDQASCDKFGDELYVVMKDMFYKYFEAVIASEGYDISVDEFLDLAEISMDDILDEAMSAYDAETMFKTARSAGNYLVKDGKLFLSAGVDLGIDENIYDTYEISGDKLTLTKHFGNDEDALPEEFYPLVFEKQK